MAQKMSFWESISYRLGLKDPCEAKNGERSPLEKAVVEKDYDRLLFFRGYCEVPSSAYVAAIPLAENLDVADELIHKLTLPLPDSTRNQILEKERKRILKSEYFPILYDIERFLRFSREHGENLTWNNTKYRPLYNEFIRRIGKDMSDEDFCESKANYLEQSFEFFRKEGVPLSWYNNYSLYDATVDCAKSVWFEYATPDEIAHEFRVAVSLRDYNKVEVMFALGRDKIDVNAMSEEHHDAMYYAISNKDERMIMYLYGKGARLDHEGRNYFERVTPEIQKMLVNECIAKGRLSDLYAAERTDILSDPSFLVAAAREKKNNFLMFFAEHGASIEAALDKLDHVGADYCASQEYIDCTYFLLKAAEEIKKKKKDGEEKTKMTDPAEIERLKILEHKNFGEISDVIYSAAKNNDLETLKDVAKVFPGDYFEKNELPDRFGRREECKDGGQAYWYVANTKEILTFLVENRTKLVTQDEMDSAYNGMEVWISYKWKIKTKYENRYKNKVDEDFLEDKDYQRDIDCANKCFEKDKEKALVLRDVYKKQQSLLNAALDRQKRVLKDVYNIQQDGQSQGDLSEEKQSNFSENADQKEVERVIVDAIKKGDIKALTDAAKAGCDFDNPKYLDEAKTKDVMEFLVSKRKKPVTLEEVKAAEQADIKDELGWGNDHIAYTRYEVLRAAYNKQKKTTTKAVPQGR